MTDIAPVDLYADSRARAIELARSLSDDDAARVVTLTPGWTVRETLAHLVGLNADLAAGMKGRLGTDENTARQVATRAELSVDEICDEWVGHTDTMAELLAERRPIALALAADLIVHLHDIQHALDLPIDTTDAATISAGQTYAARITGELDDEVALTIHLGDDTYESPAAASGTAGPTLRTTHYDFLRSATGRRSRAEVLALGWEGDAATVIDRLCPYGPLRETDAGV